MVKLVAIDTPTVNVATEIQHWCVLKYATAQHDIILLIVTFYIA